MDGLTLKIINGNRKALSLAKTLITTPTLINVDIRQGAIYAIPLRVETNQKRMSAEVSESLIIATNSKENVTDNIAPGSKSWSLTGYIKGIPRLEPTNYFQPYVQLHTDILWNWAENGAILIYKDGNAQIHKNVVIKDLQTAQQKDSANGTPFSMTLKQLNVLQTNIVNMAEDTVQDVNGLRKSLPVFGSVLGMELEFGVTAAETTEDATI